MKFMKRIKGKLSLFLAVIIIMMPMHMIGRADDLINLNPYRVVFRGKSLNAFGKTHRDMNIYQVGDKPGAVPALCIQEGYKIPDCSAARYEYYEVKPGQAVPVIGPFERYLAMVLAYEWLVSGNYYDPARYGVAQVYYWGCMIGHEHSWELQEQAMHKLQAAMDGNAMVMTYYEEMKTHILEGEAEYAGTGNTSLPQWSGSEQKMDLKDGRYELTLDISSCPQLRDTTWSFPDGAWSYQISEDGKNIIFQYNGAQQPAGTISSAEIQGIETRFYAYIFTPAASEHLQKQMGWLDLERPMATAFFKINPHTPDTPGAGGRLELYRHSETFSSSYNIDLEKYCAETNQPLEGTTFNVWEDFDFSQINETGYTEGAPDGTMGQVYLNRMSPEPESDYICDTITTDADGKAGHSDTRYYNYSKTYCMGHPAPDWVECDHEEDEECGCDEENERLREQWAAEQELCASTCDFHVQNDDESDQEQDTAAMEAMLSDRDETYEKFINLEYSYHLQEKTARTGYILHGLHRDDKDIETVILTSAQSGGKVRTGSYMAGPAARQALEPVYTLISYMEGLRAYTYPAPEDQSQELDEQRRVVSIQKEKQKEKQAETEMPENAENAEIEGCGNESLTSGGEENGSQDPGDTDGGSQDPGVTDGGSQDQGVTDGGSQDPEVADSGPQDPGSAGSGIRETNRPEKENQDSGKNLTAQRSDHSRIILFSSTALETHGKEADDSEKKAGNDIEYENITTEDIDEEQNDQDDQDEANEEQNDRDEAYEEYEEYEYIRPPLTPSFQPDITFTEKNPHIPEEENGIARFLRSLLSADEDSDSVTAALPPFIDDSLGSIDVSAYGEPDAILYTFKVWDHRTEGRIHINKRDLELYKDNKDGSFGQTQGDATLEGAVYGLFAAQDVVHPDGMSGIVYNQNDLVAVAATDQKGDASFLAFTEKPGTRLKDDGTIFPPQGITGPENLYQGSSITSSSQGFGAITYPDYAAVNGDQWIGRPLLMGNYYIKELSRSEGYELSVNGISLTETNRTQGGEATVRETGLAQVAGGLSDYNNMNGDGSWNDFIVETYKTEHGYDITVTGYPEGAAFYRIDTERQEETVKIVTGSALKPKMDEHGNPVFQTAGGGEYKTDSNGNPILKEDTATDSSPDKGIPCGETLYYRFRTAPYPGGSAAPEDMSKWGGNIAEEYLAQQVNGMLGQLGYKAVSPDSPWKDIELAGATNAQAATEIMDWFTAHNFFDCGFVESVYEQEGKYCARLLYDYSVVNDSYPAVYDSVNQKLYVHKTVPVDGGPAGHVGYWIEYPNGSYSLRSRTASVKEKRAIKGAVSYGDNIEAAIETICQPVYETYREGEILLDRSGNPIPVLERVYTYEDRQETVEREKLVPVNAVYDAARGTYTIHQENTTDWKGTTDSVYTTFRAVTHETSIDYQGEEMPYNQYLTDVAGAGVSVYAAIPAFDAGSYIAVQSLVYPGQNQPVQDGGTEAKPVQVLERVIKQSIKVTKDISQTSYDGINTYGSLHNDPLTVLLGLFNNDGSSQGTKILNQFKFKAYLKSNLENIYVDDTGTIISEDIGTNDFTGDVQKIYLPPKEGGGRRLLETKDDGTLDYIKFFDAMYAADRKAGETHPAQALKQFAIDYYPIDAYKQEILAAEPELNSDVAYDRALKRGEEEADAYLDTFVGLDRRLAIAWDGDSDGGADGDSRTLQCNTKNGKDDYYNHSIMLPYGTYVIVEQTPGNVDQELANRHFTRDYPKEVTLPFVPDISQDGNTGETDVNYQTGSPYYRYNSKDTPEDLIRKYKIRFNEESHIIQAHGQDGDFEVYKYGLDKDKRPGHSLTSHKPYEAEYMDGKNAAVKSYYSGYTSQSEDGGAADGVVYNGYETSSGQMEVRDGVAVMTGVQTAVEGKFAAMLVPWTVLAPAVDRVNPDTGNVETLIPGGGGADFNFVAFAQEDFEDAYYGSKLRIEKLDAETGDNIIHDGALFKIYAAKRDVEKNGMNSATGTGHVLFGQAVDWKGNPVVDGDGAPILYPRVGRSNGGTEDLPIRLDQEGIPQYDESQLIKQEDQEGNETGIFRAYSTIREVVIDGKVQKESVGYIETYRPLGAGAYVLVEIQAPEGYNKSRPAAFEVYADDVTYYKEKRNLDGTTEGWEQETAARYQYAIPVTGDRDKFQNETVSRIEVLDYPSRLEIHKVEDGDSMTGNQNVLQETDAQGMQEPSGGFSGGFPGDIKVNDTGDLLIYKVHGRKEKLEERGDVRDITYDRETRQWYGYVTKALDEFSEHIVEGTEKALKSMAGVKVLYELDGTFSGKGIRFDIPVSGARLSLYKAVEIEKTGEHTYKGVTVFRQDGKVTGIQDSHTGTHKEIQVTGPDRGPAALDVWDSVTVHNEPVNLYYYDLEQESTRSDPKTGELWVLDQRGNKLCCADSLTGMAYVYDDYGRMLAYTVDDEGNKELVKSIQVMDDGAGQTIYEGKTTVDDEKGLPIYYMGGNVVTKDESWTTDASTDPYGNPETKGAVHAITRLPFGSYILQEETVPYDQGYIQARHMGLVLRDTDEVQKYFMQNEFTKTAFAKIDVRTQKEIKGAAMTLYRVILDEQGMPVTEPDGTYRKGDSYAAWLSGYQYDDNGILQLDQQGHPIPTDEPHWIDHIPVGYYLLEETVCPYEQGYVQSQSVNIEVKETGNVQSFEMEDDFTAIDIRKYDTQNGDIIYGDSDAYLTLYPAELDENGNPVIENGLAQYEESELIFTFRAATHRDGQEVAATGRVTPDAGGNNPIMKYDYEYHDIPNTYQGRYYYTEDGATRLEYLPAGSYVLTESSNPEGYATADPVLITIEDKGHLSEILQAEMGDQPLRLEVAKVHISGGKEVNGAKMAIYPVDDHGNVSENPLVLHQPDSQGKYQDITAEWVSGLDGRYTEEDESAGNIPAGFEAGDLKPHLIEYIPEGNYVLREMTAPYGFLQSVDMPFTVTDTQVIQKVEMTDHIPRGVLKITKSDSDHPEQKLSGVSFQLSNKDTGLVCETVTTDEQGQAQFGAQPIGYMDSHGNFKPYTYVCRETKAASGHMLTLKPYEFQFEYKNELTDIIVIEYNPTNDSNRVVTDKLLGDTDERLEGVTLRIERRTPEGWTTVEEWVTGKQGHYTRNLQGGAYRLIEIKAAEGFKLLADPIEFAIEDGMTEIPRLVMRNYSTIVEIQKTVSGKDTLLAGARLQLIDKHTGKIIGEWTSEAGKGQRFYGLEPGIYVIHEIQAPPGYEKAQDREVTVNEYQKTGQGASGQVQVFRFENRISSSSGGGGGDNPKPQVEYIRFKKTDTSGRVIEGAEFTFYDPNGRVIGTSVSDRSGTFRIRKPENGTYTFRETKAPAGYIQNPDIFSFTVSDSNVIRGTYEVTNSEQEVTITKLDGDNGLPLSGARLGIQEAEGLREDFEGTTGSDGTITFHPPAPGRYMIHELEAPQGYVLPETTYEFTVDENGQAEGDTRVYNWKEAVPARKIGKITAIYKVKDRFGKGTYHFGRGSEYKVRTGDDLPVFAAALTAVFCAAGFAACRIMRRKREWTTGKKIMVILLFLIPVMLALTFDSLAQEPAQEQEQAQARDQAREDDSMAVSDQIVYPAMEAAEPVPQAAWVTAVDDRSGKEKKVLLPLTNYRFSDSRWEDGFELEATISDYGADRYDLNGTIMDALPTEDSEGMQKIPSEEWETKLLAQAGLERETYRIDGIQWKGEAYEKDGILCRDLKAVGRKRVADCMAVYGGSVNRSIFTEDPAENGPDPDMTSEIYGGIGGDREPGNRYPWPAVMTGVLLVSAGAVFAGVKSGRVKSGRVKSGKMAFTGKCITDTAAFLFLLGTLFSLIFLVRAGQVYAKGRQLYQDVQSIAYMRNENEAEDANPEDANPEDADTEDANPDRSRPLSVKQPAINEQALQAINPEYRFWLSVPGTGMEYPVVQHQDNQYYLNRGFNQEKHIAGSIFADCREIPLAADNTILYGHNMKDGSMFGGLKGYCEEDFYREHPFIRIFYRGKWQECPVYSCQLCHENDAGAYGMNLMKEEWLPYLGKMARASLYDTGITPKGDEKLITLSTCYGRDRRLIVQALIMEP